MTGTTQNRSVPANLRAELEATLAQVTEWTTAEDAALIRALRMMADRLDSSYTDRTMNEYLHGLSVLYDRKDKRVSELPPVRRFMRSMDDLTGRGVC